VKQATQTDKKLLTSKEWHKRKYIIHHDKHESDGRVRPFYQQQCKLCMRGENLSASRHAQVQDTFQASVPGKGRICLQWCKLLAV